MRTLYFIFFLFIVPLELMSQQFPGDQWHQGEAVLKDQSVISGMINYDLQREVIMINVGERTETYSAHLVMKFTIIQEGDERLRRFFSLPYVSQNGYKTIPRFFEVMIEGKMTLLAREYIDQITSGANQSRYSRNNLNNNLGMNSPNNQMFTRRFLSYNMFFLDHKGKLTEYTGRKKDIYNVLTEDTHELKKYVKTNRLKMDKLIDVAKLVAHYNTLI